ncbi:MAG TPA: hypothetical protein VN606_20255 [Thermoleophilaceae bacterium]|jgi:hypothetical protein|nr:hypothetical protein [Thermoleophilaceae bacterium]
MFKKICIAVFVGALLSPVGLALSNTGGKGLAKGGSSYCSKKARAAGGYHPICTSTSRTTITKYKTVTKPVTTTRYTNRTTTSTKYNTYTVTTKTGGGEVVVTEHITPTITLPGTTETITESEKADPVTSTASTTTYTDATTSTVSYYETVTSTYTTTLTTTITEGTFN